MNRFVVAFVWFVLCSVAQGYLPNGVSRAAPRTRSLFALCDMTLEELEKNVKIYLAFKNSTEISDLENPKDYKDIGTSFSLPHLLITPTHSCALISYHLIPSSYLGLSPLDMFKPRGWYKDTYALDIKSRSDATIPKISHPLSYVELQRFGWGNLTIPIMELGESLT